ncbi:MAG: hypothetical protein ACI9D4_002044, partial [Polaribacter sp.]
LLIQIGFKTFLHFSSPIRYKPLKINIMYVKKISKTIVVLLSVLVVFTSCSEDTESEVTDSNADLTLEQSKQAAKTDEVSTKAFNIIETAFIENEEEKGATTSLFSDCVEITISAENDITFIILDFGFGCELNNGNIVAGKIHISYTPIQNDTRNITYSFEDFYINSRGIEGGGTIFREHSNASGNPQSTLHKNIVVTFESGLVATVDGVRVREWVEGVGSGTWMDNVYLVTGNWTADFSSGFSRSVLVTYSLRREATCQFFVSGTVDVSRNDISGTLNYGDGTCDNTAILTVNGNEYIITLQH